MGIDLGIHKAALAILEEDQLICCDEISSDNVARDTQLYEVSRWAYQLGLFHEVDSVWIEDVLIGNNRKYSLQLAETKGAMLSSLSGLRYGGTDIRMVDVQTWKKQVVGSGHASKEDIKNYIHVTHPAYAPLCGDDQDKYDATCIGLYGRLIHDRAAHLQL